MFGNALVDAFKDMLETGWTSSNHAVLHQTQRQRQFSALEEQPFDILSRAYVLDLQDACTKITKHTQIQCLVQTFNQRSLKKSMQLPSGNLA
jgi:hypothetical protein